jgi:hypothetical protein
MTRRDMAHRVVPDVDHDPRAPISIDWPVVLPLAVAVVLVVLAFLAGVFTIGGPS